jgi:hypothetical protein
MLLIHKIGIYSITKVSNLHGMGNICYKIISKSI